MVETFEAVHLGFGCFSQKKALKVVTLALPEWLGLTWETGSNYSIERRLSQSGQRVGGRVNLDQ